MQYDSDQHEIEVRGDSEAVDRIRVVVVDDHPVVRFGVVELLRSQPDIEVVGEAENCGRACDAVAALEPDVVLLDLELGDASGTEALSRVRKIARKTRTIVFTAFDNDWRVMETIKIGVHGYLVKGADRDKMLEAVRVVGQGGTFIDPSVAGRVLGQMVDGHDDPAAASGHLTRRELSVLHQVAKGKRNKEISKSLYISERTVKFHMSALLRKLGASNRTEAIRIAVNQGLLQL